MTEVTGFRIHPTHTRLWRHHDNPPLASPRSHLDGETTALTPRKDNPMTHPELTRSLGSVLASAAAHNNAAAVSF